MPWWGWLIIALIVIGLPIKLKLFKKIFENKKKKEENIEEEL